MNGRTSSVAQLNYASSNSRTICPQPSLHNVLWRSRVKVLFFCTYPPLDTRGHTLGYPATRMDTSVHNVHVHNTYIYKYLFPIDIYICMLLGVSFLAFKLKGLIVFSKWWASSVRYPANPREYRASRLPNVHVHLRRMVGQLQNQVGMV